jgi:uncharacterized membrane protein
MATNIVALYDDLSTAQQVVRALRDAGIPSADISLVALDAAGEYGKYITKTTTKVKDSTADGVDAGAGVGALVGGLGGLLVGLGALAIPGIGPVLAAGPLATAVAAIVGAGVGAAAGGAVGGIIGGLVDLGIPEEQAHYYAEGIRRGGVLVTARTSDVDTQRVHGILNRYSPANIEDRAAAWRQEGWKGYNEKAKPYTAAQISQERARYGAAMSQTPGAAYRTDVKVDRSGTNMTMDENLTNWRNHYQKNFAKSGWTFERYEPAYQYGYDLYNDKRYSNWDWARLEPEARRTWETRYPEDAWDKAKLAVRYAWESIKDFAT